MYTLVNPNFTLVRCGVHYTDILIYFDVNHLATCCHKNQLHNFAVRGYLAITFFRVFKKKTKKCPCNI